MFIHNAFCTPNLAGQQCRSHVSLERQYCIDITDLDYYCVDEMSGLIHGRF